MARGTLSITTTEIYFEVDEDDPAFKRVDPKVSKPAPGFVFKAGIRGSIKTYLFGIFVFYFVFYFMYLNRLYYFAFPTFMYNEHPGLTLNFGDILIILTQFKKYTFGVCKIQKNVLLISY